MTMESPRTLGRRGTAMAEMLVATLLVALAVSMVMGALLNAPTQGKRSEISEKAHSGADLLLETLANYTRDPQAASDPEATPPGVPAWHLPGDACTALPADCWALAACPTGADCHTATAMLPGDFRAAPYNATMSYRVWTETSNGETIRNVSATVNWDRP
jgi:hypothetical protein